MIYFQNLVISWLKKCFSPKVCNSVPERCHRFLEESLELVQSLGVPKEDALMLVEYVYGRPVGEPEQEMGGVMVTLAALGLPTELNMDYCAWREYNRINTSEIIKKIQAKQLTKPQSGPLPGTADKT